MLIKVYNSLNSAKNPLLKPTLHVKKSQYIFCLEIFWRNTHFLWAWKCLKLRPMKLIVLNGMGYFWCNKYWYTQIRALKNENSLSHFYMILSAIIFRVLDLFSLTFFIAFKGKSKRYSKKEYRLYLLLLQ